MIRVGDLVLIERPKLPARLGVVTKLGSRVYVRFGWTKPKRYSYASVSMFLRTGVLIVG